jgi:hypothetical protein
MTDNKSSCCNAEVDSQTTHLVCKKCYKCCNFATPPNEVREIEGEMRNILRDITCYDYMDMTGEEEEFIIDRIIPALTALCTKYARERLEIERGEMIEYFKESNKKLEILLKKVQSAQAEREGDL